MTFSDLIPWARGDRSNRPQPHEPDWAGAAPLRPFRRLHSQMHRLFDDVLSEYDPPFAGPTWPSPEELASGRRTGADEKDLAPPSPH